MDEWYQAVALVESADLVLVVGTSGIVHPAAGLPAIARGAGAVVVEVNPLETEVSHIAHQVWRETAAVALPSLLAAATSRLPRWCRSTSPPGGASDHIGAERRGRGWRGSRGRPLPRQPASPRDPSGPRRPRCGSRSSGAPWTRGSLGAMSPSRGLRCRPRLACRSRSAACVSKWCAWRRPADCSTMLSGRGRSALHNRGGTVLRLLGSGTISVGDEVSW